MACSFICTLKTHTANHRDAEPCKVHVHGDDTADEEILIEEAEANVSMEF